MKTEWNRLGRRARAIVSPLLAILAAFTLLGLTGSVVFAEEKKFEDFDHKNFDRPTKIDNEWLPLKPGMRYIYKGTTIDVIGQVLGYCNEAGIATEIGVFVGYPGETAAEAEDSLSFIKQNRDSIDRADTGPFRLLKGAPVALEINPACLPPGKTSDDYWYTMEYCNPEYDAHREKYQQIIEEIESLYPNLKLMDISQEILYLARYGKQVLRTLTNNQSGSSANGEYQDG